jgi:predicted esterase
MLCVVCGDTVHTFTETMHVTSAQGDTAHSDTAHSNAKEDVKVLIFLHGVGGSGNDFTNFLEKIVPSSTRLILPTAPKAAVSMFGLMEMNSW